MSRGSLFVLLLIAPAVWSQTAESPSEVVAGCVGTGETDAYGVHDLELACPGIEHALVELGYAPFISASQLDELSIYSLADVQELNDRYAPRDEVVRGISTDSVATVLESLRDPPRAEHAPTLLERFRRWLRDVFQRNQNPDDSWLSRWLEDVNVPEAVTRAIVYSLMLLVVVLAVGVLINELRAAGILRRRGSRQTHAGAAADMQASVADLTLADLESVTPRERPSALLRILVASLVKRGQLHSERSLTHRELVARAALDDAQRNCFGEVSGLSERSVYGNTPSAEAEIERVVRAGRELAAQIAAARPAANVARSPAQ